MNNDDYLTEHWLFQGKDEFQEFIKQERLRLNDSLKDVKPFLTPRIRGNEENL